jgi:hypothetical protein
LIKDSIKLWNLKEQITIVLTLSVTVVLINIIFIGMEFFRVRESMNCENK